jgi:hypothetical protein
MDVITVLSVARGENAELSRVVRVDVSSIRRPFQYSLPSTRPVKV